MPIGTLIIYLLRENFVNMTSMKVNNFTNLDNIAERSKRIDSKSNLLSTPQWFRKDMSSA